MNEARRAHKAAKERLAQLRKYAKEFEVKLDDDKPAGTEDDGDTPKDGDGNTPKDGDGNTTKDGDGNKPESTEGSKPKRHLEVVPD